MATLSADLFGTPLVPGLTLGGDILDGDEEAALIERIDAQDLTPFRFQGWLGKRLTHSFGWHYDFDSGSFGETDPIPDWLQPLRRRAADFARLPTGALAQALLIRYDPGAGIGWHKDRPVFEEVVGVSLGAPAAMRFRRRRPDGFDRATAPLPPRSVYLMSGEVRHEWEHSIAEVDERRWSVTFRTFAAGSRPRGG